VQRQAHRAVQSLTAAALAAIALLLVSAPPAALATRAGHTAASHGRGARGQLQIAVGGPLGGPVVPRDFIGLSYEVKELPLVASLASHGDFVSLLRSIGPGVLRFGGVTADSQVAWVASAGTPLPAWATTRLTPADLYSLAALTRASGWRVVLALNLAHFSPATAADEAGTARAALGSSLQAVEIGNEPTAFVAEHLRGGSYTFGDYRHEVDSYREAIEAAAPGLAIDGPDNEPRASNRGNLRWTRADARELDPSVLTGHLYGMSKCAVTAPTDSSLLSDRVQRRDAVALRQLTAVARRYKREVWLDETNDVSCGGEPGVSDSLASTLWAVDLLTQAMKPPFVGAAFHGFLEEPDGYTPLAVLSEAALAAGEVQPRAEWYGLSLAHEVLGERPLRVRLTPAGTGLGAWAGRSHGGGVDLLLVNRNPSTPVTAAVSTRSSARIESITRLQAPSLAATTGIGLRTIAPPTGEQVVLPPSSAELVELAR